MIDQLPKWLMEGNSVKLAGFGSFRLSFSSSEDSVKEDITADSIKDIQIIFDPDATIKERVNKTKVNPMG